MFHWILSLIAIASAAPKLGKPYRNLVHPNASQIAVLEAQSQTPAQSPVHHLIDQQTPVKSQQDRGTCSIFSSIALLESLLIRDGRASRDVDLSEEWLQFLTTLQTAEEGSTSPDNFSLLRTYGVPTEATLPYIGETWTSKAQGLAAKRCGHLPRGDDLRACLISHRDRQKMWMSDTELLNPLSIFYAPDFVAARREAFAAREAYFTNQIRDGIVTDVREIRALLNRGIPLALDFDFYYGAWQHPEGEALGINHDPKLYKQGLVTHAEPESADLAYSKRSPAGHSVLVVGYDDLREVRYKVRMKDGRLRTFTRRGVYYFKNSWGDQTWGSEFEINGVRYPGYGAMLQIHAHEHAQFFKLLPQGR